MKNYIAVTIVALVLHGTNGFKFFGSAPAEPAVKPNESSPSSLATLVPEGILPEVSSSDQAEPGSNLKTGILPNDRKSGAEEDYGLSLDMSTPQPDVQVDDSAASAPNLGDLNEMEKSGIVPNYISKLPNSIMTMKIDNMDVLPGTELTPTQVQNSPIVQWPSQDECFYTLINMNLNVEGSTMQYLQWLVVNIPGTNINNGTTVMEYLGPQPPEKTGLHRVVFLVYKQPTQLDAKKYSDIREVDMDSRAKYPLADILRKLTLQDAESGNFYRAQYDSNVPSFMEERLKKLAKN